MRMPFLSSTTTRYRRSRSWSCSRWRALTRSARNSRNLPSNSNTTTTRRWTTMKSNDCFGFLFLNIVNRLKYELFTIKISQRSHNLQPLRCLPPRALFRLMSPNMKGSRSSWQNPKRYQKFLQFPLPTATQPHGKTIPRRCHWDSCGLLCRQHWWLARWKENCWFDYLLSWWSSFPLEVSSLWRGLKRGPWEWGWKLCRGGIEMR